MADAKLTSLLYLERDGKYLMLHRVKREHDENAGKWIGVGGKFEEGESPEECVIREAREETGLTVSSPVPRGIVTFVSDEFGTQYMHLFTADRFTGTLLDCDEGELEWVDKSRVPDLPLWEGDRVFLRLLSEGAPFFLLKLVYRGDTLTRAVLNGRELTI
ncbi:MAG: 8-oxo-dGTP diphosphatase [Clostridia bacterium]|nr:8-oxo-dGTP diphosphatase [Clostridia bacterium]